MKKATLLLPLAPLLFLTACGQPKEPEVTKIYTITFVDGDEHTLLTTQVEEGTYPVYEGDTPTKDADFPHEYVYTGWDKEITKATEDTTYTATFDYVFLFGTYPQKLVSDPELIQNIQEYGQPGTLEDYVQYDGTDYFLWKSQKEFIADDGTHVYPEQEYYYEVDPIKWTILGEETNYFFTTYNLLDTGIYNSTEEYTAEHPNFYGACSMRAWMNNQTIDGFYGRAFNAEEKSKFVDEPSVRNDLASTMDTIEGFEGDPTADKVFSLSRQELRDETLGFANKDNIDKSRLALTTDFARARGAGVMSTTWLKNYGIYWTRSPSNNEHTLGDDVYAYNVTLDGAIGHQLCDAGGRCYRPAIKLKSE